MSRRMVFHRQVRMQPGGPWGCLLTLAGLAGMVVFAVFVVLPVLGIAIGIGLGGAVAAAIVYGYLRIKWAIQRRLDRREAPYEAEVIDEDVASTSEPPRRRLEVQVRRRPPSS